MEVVVRRHNSGDFMPSNKKRRTSAKKAAPTKRRARAKVAETPKVEEIAKSNDAAGPLDPGLVHDRASFLAFVRTLAADYRLCAPYGRGAMIIEYGAYGGLWENLTVGEFLDAGVSWVESLGGKDTEFPGTEADFPAEPTWKGLARFLFLCKSYFKGRDI